MKGFRSPMLGALLALALTPAIHHAVADAVESILDNALSYVPDLPRSETMDLLLADVNAGALVGPSHEHEARRVADDVIAWANGGRRPLLLRDEAVSGEWRARLLFDGPGAYITELYSPASEPYRGAESWATYRIPTRAAAWERAVKEAKERDLNEQVARLSAVMGRDVRPEVERLLADRNITGEWLKLRDSLNAAAGKQASENGVLVGDAEAGPVTPMEATTFEQFAARHGLRGASAQAGAGAERRTIVIYDDLVTQPPTPEQRAKMTAWFDEALARRGKGRPVVGIDHGREVLSTIRDDAGRALAHVAMPAGRPLTMDDISATRPVLYQPKLEPVQRPDWPPRYSAKPKPARPPKGPEVRAEQRSRKAGRTAAKKRRGWA